MQSPVNCDVRFKVRMYRTPSVLSARCTVPVEESANDEVTYIETKN